MNNYVWESTVEDGAWHVGVVRDEDPYVGHLEVRRQTSAGELVHQETVKVAYGAPVAADSADVNYWRSLAMNAIANVNSRATGA